MNIKQIILEELEKEPFYHVEKIEPTHSLLSAHLNATFSPPADVPREFLRVKLGSQVHEGWGQHEHDTAGHVKFSEDPEVDEDIHSQLYNDIDIMNVKHAPANDHYQIEHLAHLIKPERLLVHLANSKYHIGYSETLNHDTGQIFPNWHFPDGEVVDHYHVNLKSKFKALRDES